MTPLVIAAVKAASTMSTTAKLWWGLKEGVTVVAEAAETLNKGKEVVNTGAEVYHWLTDKKEESAKAENSIDGVEVEIDEDQSFFAIPNQTLQAALDKFKEEAPVNMDAYRKQNFYANSNPNRLAEREEPQLKRTNSSPSLR